MSYYDPLYLYRAPITVYNGGVGATHDAEITIPPDLDHFWDTVLATAADLRVTSADGRTLVAIDATLNTTTQVGLLELDNVVLAATSGTTFWLYWGNAAAVTVIAAFVPVAAKTGYLGQDVPLDVYTLRAAPERPGATKPSAAIAVAPAEAVNFYIDVDDLLIRRATPFSGSLRYEEVASANFRVDQAGVDKTAMYDETYTRVLEVAGRTLIRVRALSLTAGNYTGVVQVTTSLDARLIEYRFLIKSYATSEV